MIFSKASGVNDSAFGKSQEPIKMYLERLEESFEAMSMLDKIFFMDKTNQFGEKYAQETNLGDFAPVGENGNYPRSSLQVGFEKFIEPEEWKLAFAITQTMLEDGKVGKAIKKQGQNLMLSYHRTREKFGAEILRNAIGTTMKFGSVDGKAKEFNVAGADGKAFFAPDHPSATRGTKLQQSNLFDESFSYDSLSYAEEAMQKFKDDDGQLLNINPDTIIIPNNARIKKRVFEVLNAEGIPGNSHNDGNFQLGRWDVIVWNYLSNPAGITSGEDWWILMDSAARDIAEALVWLERVPLTVRSWIDNNNDANVFNGRARFGASPNNWRAFAACVPGMGTKLTT